MRPTKGFDLGKKSPFNSLTQLEEHDSVSSLFA